MKRYNQGFGKFGPMEQSNDGKWVLYEDYGTLLKKLELHKELLENTRKEYAMHAGNAWRETHKVHDKLINWQAFSFCQAIIIIILAIYHFA
ncbi:hypothetical protein UFOVP84_108 [uncultured Caudovirales phage]|uniref:Uncharacterized protein n=1 Tax=uncultured Caudovirales phage TaxID=2100421 RepID=A0A6J5L412_9CAUD|nr:hypothetical protein UFOVP84_108 [uncultured Caudovirales phage]